ncbi:hypothetical protein RHGRI_037232 [Rhododendron griersonianum]|uniref:F-box protein n=1 Tax=Rhododendron griersonianum TaxID=479676 RepID=A0AAV6HWF6_9ERIC|nr:hypothetical protein RHGRI_037232 [Rhododendron griersonianum]
MASIRASNVTPSSFPSSSSRCRREMTARATINMPKLRNGSSLSLPKITTIGLAEELQWRSDYKNKTTTQFEKLSPSPKVSDPMAMAKLYAIMEAVADRVEMHENIGEQRNNWNSLLLTSINSITLTASVMTGVAAMGAGGAPLVALKLSSTLLYLAATGMLLVMNKIQPSQLAEEQRNAARWFKQLYEEIRTTGSIGAPNSNDVKEATAKVLALDRAYPLPLLGCAPASESANDFSSWTCASVRVGRAPASESATRGSLLLVRSRVPSSVPFTSSHLRLPPLGMLKSLLFAFTKPDEDLSPAHGDESNFLLVGAVA